MIAFQSTVFSVVASLTINLSLGDLPVNVPVLTATAPLSAITPIPFSTVWFTNSSGLKFQKTLFTLLNPNSVTSAVGFFTPTSFIVNLFSLITANLVSLNNTILKLIQSIINSFLTIRKHKGTIKYELKVDLDLYFFELCAKYPIKIIFLLINTIKCLH